MNDNEICAVVNQFQELTDTIKYLSGIGLKMNNEEQYYRMLANPLKIVNNSTEDLYSILSNKFTILDFVSFINTCHLFDDRKVKINGLSPNLKILFNNGWIAEYYATLGNSLFIELCIELYWSFGTARLEIYINEIMAFNIPKDCRETINFIIAAIFDLSKASCDVISNNNSTKKVSFLNGLEGDNLVIIYSNIF